MSRYMKRLAREAMEEDPDGFKVRNDHPSEEFAFDLSPICSIGEIVEMTEEQAVSSITAHDDYDNPVSSVPVGDTGSTVFLSFASSGPVLPDMGPQASVGRFVWHLCTCIARHMCERPAEFGIFIPPSDVLSLRMTRFFWDSMLASWVISWQDDPQRPLPTVCWRDGLTRMKSRIEEFQAGLCSLEDAVFTAELVLDCDYPQMAKDGWGGLTQLVYDYVDADRAIPSPEETAMKTLAVALHMIDERLAQLPSEGNETS